MKPWLFTLCAVLKLLGIGIVWTTDHTLLGWLVFLAGGLIFVAHLIVPNWQGACEVITRFEPADDDCGVWLTIDDGPDPEDTPQILKLLEQHQATATFFLIGERAARHPELVRAIREAGHEIGCHTHTHPTRWFWIMGPERVAAEIDRALEAIGGEISLFRSPVGIKNVFLSRIIQERGLRYLGWTIRSGDGLGRELDPIVRRVRRLAAPGSIILMHEGPSVASGVRVEAIRSVLAGLAEDGLRCVRPRRRWGAPPEFSIPPTTTTKEPLCN